jgi:hypothetical protein
MAKRGFIKYKSYSFVDKDPVIDSLRSAVSASKLSYRKLHEDSGVAVSTMHNWFHGNTRRPQFATVAAVLRAAGKRGIIFSSNSGSPRLIG